MEEPLVSVVTVTRNRSKLIGRCIRSVLNQTYKNVEHIVVDGASEDDTEEVVQSFNDKRLKYHRLESNWPVVKTTKFATSLAKGKYLCFLDDDDEYVSTKIEKELHLIESLPEDYGLVYCWMTYYDSSKKNEIIRVHNPQLRGFVPIDAVEKPTVSGTPTFMFRKKAFDEVGGWDEKAPLSTDWLLGARFCHRWKVDYVPESLVNVYINHIYDRTSTQMRYNPAFLERRIGMHEYFLEEFKDTFNKRIGSRWYQYKSLSFFCMKSRKVWKTVKYSILYLINIIEHNIYESVIRPKK